MSIELSVVFHFTQAKLTRPRDAGGLQRLQQRRLRAALERITAEIPFYRQFRGKRLEELPVMTKTRYTEHFQALNRYGLSHDAAFRIAADNEQGIHLPTDLPRELYLGLSTGTSGQRGIFLTSPAERSRWAAAVIARCLPGPLWRKRKVAFFLRANNQLYASAEGSGRLQLRFFDLGSAIEISAAKLREFKPDVLIAPPYVLSLLASQDCAELQPGIVFSAADVLDPWDARAILKRFPSPLHQIYQATEGFLGATCRNGTLHLNEDLLLFERQYIDQERMRFVPVISDFYRRSQAMVRFRLNDILMPSAKSCACGSPLTAIERIEGRTDEVLLLASQNGELIPVYRNEAISAIADTIEDGAEQDFQIRQVSSTAFELHVSDRPGTGWACLVKERLHTLFAKKKGATRATIDVVGGLARPLSEKRRRVYRTFPFPGEPR